MSTEFAEPGDGGSHFSVKLVALVLICICAAVAVGVVLILQSGEEKPGETNSPPTASFTYAPQNPTIENLIQFTDTSTDPDGTVVSWSWNFGDGGTSTLQNPTHQYETAGTYTVTLTVEDNGGMTDTYTAEIEVSGTGENVFQDFETNNGTSGAYFYDAWRCTSSFETDNVHRGERAVKMVVPPEINQTNGGTIGINAASPVGYIDMSGATVVSVWVYDTQGNNTLELKLKDLLGNIGPGLWSTETSVQNTWTKITWDISEYSGVDMSRISSIELFEWNEGTYYFDDVVFK